MSDALKKSVEDDLVESGHDDLLNLGEVPRSANPISVAVQRASRLLRNDLDRILLAKSNLSLVDYRLLRHLANTEVATQKELSRSAQMEQGQVSRSLASLERRKMVSSCAYPKDRRVRLFSMLSEGRKAFLAVRPIFVEHNTRLTDFLDADEHARILDTLQKIVQNSARSAEQVIASD